MYQKIFKRITDFSLATVGLLVLSPVLMLLIIIIKFATGRSPFFLQQRLGKDAVPFRIIKFKTMSDALDPEGNLLPDEQRLNRLGRWLRHTSLDELPQLINVWKGEMSLVGPRPLLPGYFDLYNDFQKRRNQVKPGITGWAQVNGRNWVPWEKRFEMDVWYVDHCSLTTDLKIMLKTIRILFAGKDVLPPSDIPVDFPGNSGVKE